MGKETFGSVDYVVFLLSLIAPLGIGLYFYLVATFKKRDADLEGFLLGGRSMNYVAVALSLLGSLLNGAFVVGIPAEIHYFGPTILYTPIGLLVLGPIVAHIFIPTFHRLKFTSTYEYIELRFNKSARVLASCLFITSVIIFLAVVLYVPALAFNQISKVSMPITLIVTGSVCTLYTTIGGIKAVIYTDTLQMVILVIGMIIIAIIGTINAGGVYNVFSIGASTGRTDFNQFSLDPRVRMTAWNQIFGQGTVYLCLLISNQMMVQRFMAVSSPAEAGKATYLMISIGIVLYFLASYLGLVVHATFHDCDPILTAKIRTADQIFLHFMMTTIGSYSGLPGLLTACIFAAALSSVSSVINSLSAVILEDFIDPYYFKKKNQRMSERSRGNLAKIIVALFGVITILLSFLTDRFASRLSQAAGTVWGVVGGPLGGMFLLGFFVPKCKAFGAIVGCFTGLFMTFWMVAGAISSGRKPQSLPIGDCQGGNFSTPKKTNFTDTGVFQEFYKTSYAWYGVVGAGVTFIVGVLVTLVDMHFCPDEYEAETTQEYVWKRKKNLKNKKQTNDKNNSEKDGKNGNKENNNNNNNNENNNNSNNEDNNNNNNNNNDVILNTEIDDNSDIVDSRVAFLEDKKTIIIN